MYAKALLVAIALVECIMPFHPPTPRALRELPTPSPTWRVECSMVLLRAPTGILEPGGVVRIVENRDKVYFWAQELGPGLVRVPGCTRRHGLVEEVRARRFGRWTGILDWNRPVGRLADGTVIVRIARKWPWRS